MSNIPWWYTHIDDAEKQRLISAFDDKRFSMGPVTQELERRICQALDVPYAVVTPSGTAALSMALLAVDIGPRDEVIVPDLTWISTAQAAAAIGAHCVLVDCRIDEPLIDVEKLREAISPRTKAIIPVHYNGRACDMAAISALAKECGAYVIEDSCKAMCSKTRNGYLGSLGDIGCFSMGMISLVSTGYGGFAVTRDAELYNRMRLIRDHGVVRVPADEYQRLGFNFKVSDLLAAIGVAQFDRLSEKVLHLKEVYQRYADGLAGLENVALIPVDTASGRLPLLIDIQCCHREKLIGYLQANDVEISRFHPPLHEAHYLQTTAKGEQFPNAIRYATECLIVPCGPSQPLENIDKTIELIRKWRPSVSSPSNASRTLMTASIK